MKAKRDLTYTYVYMEFGNPARAIHLCPFTEDWAEKLHDLPGRLNPEEFERFKAAVIAARRNEGLV
jgi:hypothetical protein